MSVPPNASWSSAFSNINDQGTQFEGPLSPSNTYYAYLSKVDLDVTTGLYDVFFELVSKEWMDNAFFAQSVLSLQPPITFPYLAYHIPSADPSTLQTVLGIKNMDTDLAEGSWYLLALQQGTGKITGDLYDPDIDLLTNNA